MCSERETVMLMVTETNYKPTSSSSKWQGEDIPSKKWETGLCKNSLKKPLDIGLELYIWFKGIKWHGNDIPALEH